MTEYVHGYGTPEQQRLVEQAEHWRHRLIRDGTQLARGTRLLEVGCGVGAVLAVLGQEFPGIRLFGVDIEPKQLAFAREHLARARVEATLLEADALALPFEDESFDHVWMMWFLEHVADPPAVLLEAKAHSRSRRRHHCDRGRLRDLPCGAVDAGDRGTSSCDGPGHGRIGLERCRNAAAGLVA